MRARHAELVVEDERRHGRDAERAYALLARRHRLGIRLCRPALHPGACGDGLKDVGISDIARLLEVGMEERVDDCLPLALGLRHVDQLVRRARIRRALHALESELDALAASLG